MARSPWRTVLGAALLVTAVAVRTSAEGPAEYAVIPLAEAGAIEGTCSLERAVAPPSWPEVPEKVPSSRCECDPAVGPADRWLVDGTLVADCLVQVEGIRRGKDWPEPLRAAERTARVTFRGCRYEPHVQWVRAGTQVALANLAETCDLSAHLYRADGATQANVGVGPGQTLADVAHLFLDVPGVYALRCHGHPGLNASIVVADHPYVAGPTRTDGRYRIEGVPPGTYDVTCWHEGFSATPKVVDGRLVRWTYDPDVTVRRRVTVAAGATARLDFVLPVPERTAPAPGR
jgi:hypothetical protein